MAASRSKHTPESQAEYLASYDPAAFPRPSVAVDLVLMTIESSVLRVLVLRRNEYPEKGCWALPGGFVGLDESLDAAAKRVLSQKARLTGVFAEQLFTFGAPTRDPRMRVVSVAYFALVSAGVLRGAIGTLDEAAGEPLAMAEIRVPWEGEVGGDVELVDGSGRALRLAFDHASMIGMAVKRLRGRVRYSPIAFELLGSEFTLRMLQSIHEAILGCELNKDAFRRRMLATGTLVPTGRLETSVGHRPAELYRFRPNPIGN